MNSSEFAALLGRMTGAICAGKPEEAAACFTPDGVYYDGFYGEFKGRAEIARMVRDSEGRRIAFSGVSCCELDGALIRRYGEVFDRPP